MEGSKPAPVCVRTNGIVEASPTRCKDAEEEEVNDTGCGWGRFRPAILAPFANVWTFIILYIAFSFAHSVQGTYPSAVLTTLERRFNLSSFLIGLIVNASLFGYLVSILGISLVYAKLNQPRLFAGCMLLTSIGAFLYYLPHLVSGTGNDAIDWRALNVTAGSGNRGDVVQLCAVEGGEGGPSETERTCSAEEKRSADEGISYAMSAVVILYIADLVHGIAGGPGWTVGLAFIDDHTPPELSAKLVGLMFAVRMVAPIASFAMGGYFLSIHTTLKETALTQKHPLWIGAWWMGFLINSVANFVLFIPMSMLPKNLRPIKKSSTIGGCRKKLAVQEGQKENGKEEIRGENEEVEETEIGVGIRKVEEPKQFRDEMIHQEEKRKEESDEIAMEEQNGIQVHREEKEEKKQELRKEIDKNEERDGERENFDDEVKEKEDGILEKNIVRAEEETSSQPIQSTDTSSVNCKEFPKAMVRLIKNPIYVLAVISICGDWASSSFGLFIPKYFEVHFQKTPSVASLLGGMIPATCGACAAYVGGVLAGKIKGIDGGVAGLCRMNVLVSLGSLLLLIPALFLSCPNHRLSGNLINGRLNLTTACNVNCGCSSDMFDPVCGSDGLLYFSPCHAGCTSTQLVNATDHTDATPGPLVRSSDCRCVSEVEGMDGGDGGRVVFGGFCETACASLIPFVVALLGMAIVRSLDSAASTTIILRCTRREDKAYAIGIQACVLVFALLPAPLMYGRVFDSSCILKRTSSCTESKGTCLLYDRHSLRLNFYGLVLGLKCLSTVLSCTTYFLARRKLSLLTAQQEMRETRLKPIITR